MKIHRLVAHLIAATLLLVLSLVILGISQLLAIRKADSEYSRMISREISRMEALQSITAGVSQINRLCLSALIPVPNAPHPVPIGENAKKAGDIAVAQINNFKALNQSSPSTKIDAILAGMVSYESEVGTFFALHERGQIDEAKEFRLSRLRPAVENLNDQIGELVVEAKNEATLQSAITSRTTRTWSLTALAYSAWPLLLSVGIVIWISIAVFRYIANVDQGQELPGN